MATRLTAQEKYERNFNLRVSHATFRNPFPEYEGYESFHVIYRNVPGFVREKEFPLLSLAKEFQETMRARKQITSSLIVVRTYNDNGDCLSGIPII